jgi:hypothetical protein
MQWRRELAEEGMMALALPSPASTNGSYLRDQVGSAVESLIADRHQNVLNDSYDLMYISERVDESRPLITPRPMATTRPSTRSCAA